MSTTTHFSYFSLILLFLTISVVAQAIVHPSETFKFVNEGEFGEYLVEYRADYRVLSLYGFPFQLCFYNTTPNAYTLAIRMGNRHYESTMRWVWDANRGNPVRENATLTFGTDGQSLRQGGPTKFVSRVSDADGSEGPYSFGLEKKRIAMYLKSKNSPTPILYHIAEEFGTISSVVFNSAP
ncbi:hypothetical protein IFM89_031845 [Coptis chinensis]|uniref:Uncharacterized protein n=1 Tax=Coptis chinensis TaxID=261450 RepID=A0A835H113_9MAGN|nr:hypothetical protein IFM89_031845 [Coptis chinensis]